jgi:hypothetical protein
MKTNKLIPICAAVAGIIIAKPFMTYAESPTPTPTDNPLITWTATGKQSGNVDVLFVQNAKNVTFNNGKLVLQGVNPVTVCFTDRPARLAGHMQTSRFIPLWSQGKDSFLTDNPNATLSVFSGDNVSARDRSVVGQTHRRSGRATRIAEATVSAAVLHRL